MLNDNKLYARLINLINDIIVVIDRNYNILYVNEAVFTFIGNKTNIIGTKCYLSLFNNIEPCGNCELPSLINKKRAAKTIYHETFDYKGNRKYFKSNFEQIDNDTFVEFLSDTTEERFLYKSLYYKTKELKANNVRLKKYMLDSRDRYDFLNKVINSVPGGIMVVSDDLKIVEINNFMLERFTGDKNIKKGNNCFEIYGNKSQCKDCYFKKNSSRTYRKFKDNSYTVYFNKFDNYLVESLLDTTRMISLINSIKSKQQELNSKQHQMRLLNSELLKVNKRLQSAQKRIEDEIKQLRLIQKTLLPTKFVDYKGYSFGATYIPTEDVGGDYYDYIEMSNNYCGFLVADVSGHGIPAAVIMAITRALVHSYTIDIISSSEVLTMINEILKENIYTNDFVTMFYLVMNMGTGKCNYASAGHNPILFFDNSNLSVKQLKSKGFFLGPFDNVEYEEKSINMKKGDILFLYTDGLVDVQNRKGEFYGLDRLIGKLILYHENSPNEIINYVLDDIKEFSGGREYSDDITMLLIKKEE
ncbi:MAG: SpoIIE family protein phosphatase [Deferribacterota bacterium]|nr:SpoIIE family protein phosphatase [Deferribacterota bacterium]